MWRPLSSSSPPHRPPQHDQPDTQAIPDGSLEPIQDRQADRQTDRSKQWEDRRTDCNRDLCGKTTWRRKRLTMKRNGVEREKRTQREREVRRSSLFVSEDWMLQPLFLKNSLSLEEGNKRWTVEAREVEGRECLPSLALRPVVVVSPLLPWRRRQTMQSYGCRGILVS